MAAAEDSSSFDLEAEISEEEVKEGSSSPGANLVSSSIVTGFTDRNMHRDNPTPAETSTSGKPDSSSSKLTRADKLRNKKNYNQILRTLMDETAPIRKKWKILRELATVKDGAVQFEVPEDIESPNLDLGPGIAYSDDTTEVDADAIDYHGPPLQIVMLIVGTRGDVQPFVAIGKSLQAYGHRVRLATHSNFKEFVLNSGLEFFELGGDPKILAGYMVKNKGFLPSDPLEIPTQRNQIKDIVFSLFPACVEPDPISDIPFKPDAIIANPPAYDWGPNIDVVGFCFLDLASDYTPPMSLIQWLERDREKKPIYIGFGSLPLLEPKKMMNVIVQALQRTGQRGIINKGWGGLGDLEGLDMDLSAQQLEDLIYVLDNCPHDWLFLQCSAVVHHGGAGTTAAGLRAACPTTIVPFFGDQPFWGEQVHARGIGPPPIPVDEFNLEKLVDAIYFMLDAEVKNRAYTLAAAMKNEDGVACAVNAFHKHLPRKKPEDKAAAPSGLCSLRGCFGGHWIL